jgi:cell division protein FtsA
MKYDSGLTPRMKPLSSRRSATLSVLDIGTSKITCLVAELTPHSTETLRGRTHLARIAGIGHQRSHGIKAGMVVDLEAAEQAIRHAVHAAERMAKVEICSLIVNLSGGRLASERFQASMPVRGEGVTANDRQAVLQQAGSRTLTHGRAVLHALPTGYTLDQQKGILDPSGMIGQKLGVDLHVVSGEMSAVRNMMLAVERCHLDVEAMVASPYASALSTLVDDEAEMGALVLDFGAGCTTLSVFQNGHLVHCDAITVGGLHVTMDIARGLSTRLSTAERMKVLYGSCLSTLGDERDLIAVPGWDDDNREIQSHMPRSHLSRIIRPRVEEILELIRERLAKHGFANKTDHVTDHSLAGRKILLTGGASQLAGLPELVKQTFKGQVRIGRPLGVKGLPEAARGPAFATAIGLLVYPQVAHFEHSHLRSRTPVAPTHTGTYFGRFGQWLRESF